jgi:hypothetical protein
MQLKTYITSIAFSSSFSSSVGSENRGGVIFDRFFSSCFSSSVDCQPPAGGRIRSKVIKCDANGVAIMNGRRDGFITIKDMLKTMSVRGECGVMKLIKYK